MKVTVITFTRKGQEPLVGVILGEPTKDQQQEFIQKYGGLKNGESLGFSSTSIDVDCTDPFDVPLHTWRQSGFYKANDNEANNYY